MKISLAGKELAVEVGGWNWKGMAFFVEDGEDRGRGGEKIQGRGRHMLIGGGSGGHGQRGRERGT